MGFLFKIVQRLIVPLLFLALMRSFFADLFRRHNDGNVVCLSGRFVEPEVNREIVKVFLETGFEGGRHADRVGKVMRLDA